MAVLLLLLVLLIFSASGSALKAAGVQDPQVNGNQDGDSAPHEGVVEDGANPIGKS